MANWYGTNRSNYFAVKDLAAFIVWMSTLSHDLRIEREDSGRGILICLLGVGDGYWPSTRRAPIDPPEDEEMDADDEDVDFFEELAAHLPDGEVAIFVSAGAEKLRYVSGAAVAVTSKGVVEQIYLSDIGALAWKHTDRPEDITRPEY